jgi:hypothetical protein
MTAATARVRRPTPAELAAVPEDEAATAAEREVQAEEAGGAVVVPLETDDGVIDITVPAAEEWRDSAMDAIREGRFTLWAEKTLAEDDYAAWVEADPRVRQINAFFQELGRLTGIDQGNSRASRRSSGSTRRR